MQTPRYWRLQKKSYQLQGVANKTGEVAFIARQVVNIESKADANDGANTAIRNEKAVSAA